MLWNLDEPTVSYLQDLTNNTLNSTGQCESYIIPGIYVGKHDEAHVRTDKVIDTLRVNSTALFFVGCNNISNPQFYYEKLATPEDFYPPFGGSVAPLLIAISMCMSAGWCLLVLMFVRARRNSKWCILMCTYICIFFTLAFVDFHRLLASQHKQGFEYSPGWYHRNMTAGRVWLFFVCFFIIFGQKLLILLSMMRSRREKITVLALGVVRLSLGWSFSVTCMVRRDILRGVGRQPSPLMIGWAMVTLFFNCVYAMGVLLHFVRRSHLISFSKHLGLIIIELFCIFFSILLAPLFTFVHWSFGWGMFYLIIVDCTLCIVTIDLKSTIDIIDRDTQESGVMGRPVEDMQLSKYAGKFNGQGEGFGANAKIYSKWTKFKPKEFLLSKMRLGSPVQVTDLSAHVVEAAPLVTGSPLAESSAGSTNSEQDNTTITLVPTLLARFTNTNSNVSNPGVIRHPFKRSARPQSLNRTSPESANHTRSGHGLRVNTPASVDSSTAPSTESPVLVNFPLASAGRRFVTTPPHHESKRPHSSDLARQHILRRQMSTSPTSLADSHGILSPRAGPSGDSSALVARSSPPVREVEPNTEAAQDPEHEEEVPPFVPHVGFRRGDYWDEKRNRHFL